MKKVLIIGYLLTSRPGGSIRPLPLAKYLPEFGWEPVTLTPFLSEKPELQFRVIETPYKDALDSWKRLFRFNSDEDIRRQVKGRLGIMSKKSFMDPILSLIGELANYPDPERGWKPFALEAGRKLLQHENFDAMIACMPVTSYIVASELKARYQIPLVVDLTDLWSQNHNYGYSHLRKLRDARLEQKTLATADMLVTVSEPWAEKLKALHKGKAVCVISHGFDPEEVNSPPTALTAKFTITYAGSIYAGKQNPSKLFAALRDLISAGVMEQNDIEIRFYGPRYDWLEKEISEYGLSSTARHYGIVSKPVALERQWESQLLLLLDWDDPREKGVFTGKIFEYLAARRPTLATGGVYGNAVEKLLDETKAGIHAVTIEDAKNALKKLYQEYKQKGTITYKGEEAAISKYSHREMGKAFSQILDCLTEDNPTG